MAFPPPPWTPLPSPPNRGSKNWDVPLDAAIEALIATAEAAWDNDIDIASALLERGITPVHNTSEVSHPVDGQLVYNLTTRTYLRYDSSAPAWVTFSSGGGGGGGGEFIDTFRGAWSATSYAQGDIVTRSGSSWLAVSSTSSSQIPGSDSAWVLIASAGAPGAAGATGAQGPAGSTGAAGATGAAGSNGKSVLSGSGGPSSGTGVDGDFYLDTSATRLYGPKASGAWPTPGVLLIGPQGTAGVAGPAGSSILYGTSDPTSGQGSNGDLYINTSTSTLWGPKLSGSWPGSGVSLIGPAGAAGAPGAAGPGVATGGSTGQFLRKSSSTNFDTAFATIAESDVTNLTADLAAKLTAASNLADLNNAATARTNLGLGNAATRAVGTSAGTVAAGDDSRITGALQSATATTKGDILVATGAGAIGRLGVGADSLVLTADSSQAGGVTWASAGGGGAPSGPAGGDLAGSYPNPTVAATANVESIIRANRLDQLAAPTSAVGMNAQKLTGLANGTVATDAAAFGQIPTSLPPNGSAGGDLSGSYPNPTLSGTSNVNTVVRANRLDQMAAPTAAVGLNSQKITSLANGTVATDAAAFGQIPTALPPNGSAGGDLSGTYPNPGVAKVAGTAVSGTPSAGLVLTATSGTAASWTAPAVASVNGSTGAVSITTASIGAANALTPTAVKTSNYSAAAGDFVPVDTTVGSISVTLPTAPADKSVIGVKRVNGSSNVLIIAGTGDQFNRASPNGPTSLQLNISNQSVLLQYNTSLAVWYVLADGQQLSSLDSRYILASSAGAASGIATLDGTTHLTAAQLPTNVITSFATPGSSAVGDSAAAGTSTSAAHADHVHGRESFGAVTAQNSFGASSANGSATTVAHSDHTHGTPAAPTTASIGAMNAVTPTAVKTGAYTAAAGDLVPVDTTSGAVTITLPTAPADKTIIAVKHVIQGGSNAVTISRGGSDVFNKASGPTSITLTLVNQEVILQYAATPAVWYAIDELPLTGMDSRYALASAVGAASGIATLDGTSHLTAAQLPTSVITSFASPGSSAVGDAIAAGSSTSAAKADHVHGREAFAAPTATTSYGLSAVTGTAVTLAHSDHTHGTPALTTTAPATTLAIGTAAALGSATLPALADHVHPVAAAATPTTSAVGDTAATGNASTFAASNHTHGREAFGAVTAQTSFGASSANGTAATVAHSDHTHGTPAAPTASSLGAMNNLTPTAVKTSAYTAAAGDFVPVDTTSGAVTITLPNAPADKTIVGVKHVIQGSSNAVTVSRAGSDVFNKASGSTTVTLSLLNQVIFLQYAATPAIWYVVSETPVSAMDSRYLLATQLGAASGAASLDGSSLVVQTGSSGAWTATGVSTGTAISATGLTGATSGARLAGGTSSGHPTTGTFALRDVVPDASGSLWVCTSAGSPGSWTQVSGVSSGNPAYSSIHPAEYGWKEWMYPIEQCSTTGAATVNGNLHAMMLVLQNTGTISSMTMYIIGAGVTMTSGQSFAALYDHSTGNQLAVTADISGTVGGTNNAVTWNFSSSASVTAGQKVYACVVFNGTTPPTFGRNGATASVTPPNLGLTAAGGLRHGVLATGRTTAPATITPSSNSTSNAQSFWCALS